MHVVATARCLGKRCECRGCYGTDDWKVHVDEFSLRTAFELVLCRLEVQRQAVGVPPCPRYVVDIMIVQKHVVVHIVLRMREKNAEVFPVS